MATIGGPRTNESGGTGEYSATSQTTGATLSVATAAAKNGTYGLKSLAAMASDSAGEGYGEQSFSYPASAIVVVEAWVRFAAWTQGGYDTASSKSVLAMRDRGNSEGNYSARLSINGTRGLRITYYNGSFSNVAGSSTLTLSANTWYLLRLILDKSGGNPVITFKQSTDGTNFTTVEAITATDGVRGTPDNAELGVIYTGQFEKGEYEVHGDDLTIYDAEPGGAAVDPRAPDLRVVQRLPTFERQWC